MIPKEIYNADIVITPNGRTIYEVAWNVLHFNFAEREVRQLFVSRSVMDIGIVYTASEDDITSAIKKLIENFELRREMKKKLLTFDLKKGIDMILRLIFDEYYAWRENEDIVN